MSLFLFPLMINYREKCANKLCRSKRWAICWTWDHFLTKRLGTKLEKALATRTTTMNLFEYRAWAYLELICFSGCRMEIVIVSCHLMLFGTYIYHISNSTELKGVQSNI